MEMGTHRTSEAEGMCSLHGHGEGTLQHHAMFIKAFLIKDTSKKIIIIIILKRKLRESLGNKTSGFRCIPSQRIHNNYIHLLL